MKNYALRIKKVKYVFYMLFAFLVLTSLTSCSSDDEGPGIMLTCSTISVSDFTGNWNATNADFSSTTDNTRIDIIDEGGSVTFSVQSNGGFTITVNLPGESPDIFSGTLGFNEEEYSCGLIVIFAGDAPDDYELFNIQLNNNILTISGITTFDIDGDGSEEPAIVDLTLTR